MATWGLLVAVLTKAKGSTYFRPAGATFIGGNKDITAAVDVGMSCWNAQRSSRLDINSTIMELVGFHPAQSGMQKWYALSNLGPSPILPVPHLLFKGKTTLPQHNKEAEVHFLWLITSAIGHGGF